MSILVVYSALLAIAGLVSALARRTVLSTSVMFLAAGMLVGPHFLGWFDVDSEGDLVLWTTEVALFVVLFTDAMRVSASELRRTWRVPVRLLIVAMPLTMGIVALAAHFLLDLGWLEAVLVAAILGPTDPVLAEAIIGHEGIPDTIRRALNVESGLNDGLALPVVLLTASALSSADTSWTSIASEMAIGIAIGVATPLVVVGLERVPAFGTAPRYDRVMPVAVGLFVFSVCSQLHANLFLAAFAAGVTLASVAPERISDFDVLGGTATEVLKLAALFLFGILLPQAFYDGWTFALVAFVAVVLLVARPLAVLASLVGARVPGREQAVLAWFGPKGFASVTFMLLVLRSGAEHAEAVTLAAGAVVVVSIVVHASTDVPIARWLTGPEGDRGGGVPAGGRDPTPPAPDVATGGPTAFEVDPPEPG